jgi:beta-porphyranase
MYKTILIAAYFFAIINVTLAQPPAPQGYRWIKNNAFSDEFNGAFIDTTKWYPRSPYWKEGRAPATFRAENVVVKNGLLQIKDVALNPPQGKYSLAGGAVASKSKNALFGYYEVSMRASSVSMSSTFWLITPPIIIGCDTVRQELDIVELIGGAKKNPLFRYYMKSNAHYWLRNCAGVKTDTDKPGQIKLNAPADSVFHIFGCWWKDANTLDYYYNSNYAFTIHPDTSYSKTPFSNPMYMHLVTETYNWETPPTPAELADDTKNVTYYDWIRSYSLVPVKSKKATAKNLK